MKEEKSESQSGNNENKDKYYFMYSNGTKKLIKVVTEDIASDENVSDSSIKEAKIPKTLKQFYSISDSDEDKERKGNKLRQVDGNGNGSTIELSTSTFSSSSGIEEIGEKISLAPMSSCSDISVSDTSHDASERSIGKTLAEVFSQRDNADSNTNSNTDNNCIFACPEYANIYGRKWFIPNQHYLCGALQLCLPYLDETTGASAEAWVEFNRKACLS